MNVGDEIISHGGHRGYITRISPTGDIEAISCYNGGALIIDRKWIGNTWKTTGHRHYALAKIIKEITCNTQRTRS